jgi:hypothetical protein
MLMSHVFIIADSKNADHNSPKEIASAVEQCDATEVELSDNGVITATMPTGSVPDVAAMEGVRTVRYEMTYNRS